MDTQGLSNTRKNLSQLVQSAQEQGTQHVITVNGSNAAMLMSYNDYESLIETLEILQDSKIMKKLALSEEEIKNRDLISFKDLKKKYGHSDLHKAGGKRVRKTA